MTYFSDLAPCDYFGVDHGGHLLAVGWLDCGYEYPFGPFSEMDYRHLANLYKDPFEPVTSVGYHVCNLCQFDGATGNSNLFIPDQGAILVAPELILHYINAHGYRPPERFLSAMRRIESTRTIEYKKRLLKNNGQFLLPSKAGQPDVTSDPLPESGNF